MHFSPNSDDTMDRFLQSGGVWVRDVEISRNFGAKRRLGDRHKEQLAEPPKKPFLKQLPLGRQM